MMKKTNEIFIRVLSVSLFITFIIMKIISKYDFDYVNDIGILAIINSMLLLIPSDKKDNLLSISLVLILFACAVVYNVANLFLHNTNFMRIINAYSFLSIISILILLIYWVSKAIVKFSSINILFKNSSIWTSLLDYSKLLNTMVYFVLLSISFLLMLSNSQINTFLIIVMIILLIVMYCVLYYRSYFGHNCFGSKEKEDQIIALFRGNIRTDIDEDSPLGDGKMNYLYRKVTELIEKEKPFLNPNYGLEDMSRDLGTNRGYLSKTINLFSGRNFRQFINYHRVKYSIELMRKNPHTRVAELAFKSGFHSTVTYNMAFKLYMHLTPNEWCQHNLEELY